MIILDTHVLIWTVDDDPRLGNAGRAAVAKSMDADGVGISAITPWEIALLAEKGRLHLGRDVGSWIDSVVSLPGIRLMPILPTIAIDSVRLPGVFHADPADRMIIATARYHGAPLLTADRSILEYAADGHVSVIDASRG
ncbi:MAG: type II toxin-antitoxin system VapC family toxin [Acidobacteria bacterium]|nr:type II toxin-antitoxin system VapC family toxin [Acidobacteriota bacterium]